MFRDSDIQNGNIEQFQIFEQQTTIGRILIKDAKIPTAKRSGALPGLCAALKEIFDALQFKDRPFVRNTKVVTQI